MCVVFCSHTVLTTFIHFVNNSINTLDCIVDVNVICNKHHSYDTKMVSDILHIKTAEMFCNMLNGLDILVVI